MYKFGCFLILTVITILFSPLGMAKLFGQQYCDEAGFVCRKIKSGQTWNKLFPNTQDRDIVMRINRLNIGLYPGLHIAIPENLTSSTIMDFAPFPKQIQPRDEKLLVFDPRQLAWGAYDENGYLIRWGPASGGSDWCKDIDEPCRTTAGEFRIFSLGSSECISRTFPLPDGGAPMPYCMYFNDGQAFHGEPNGLPGYNASHGCVRLYVNDAKWLRYEFVEPSNDKNDFKGTKVIIGLYDDDYVDQANYDSE